jgi:hypothetical protein
MTYPDGIDALVNVNANDSLAAGGHAARHNSVNTALVEIKNMLGPSPAGKIMQIVRATDSTNRSTTSTSFVDASISVTITPQKSNSIILVCWSVRASTDSNAATRLSITDSSNVALSGTEFGVAASSGGGLISTSVFLVGYSTPATVSSVTYKGRFNTNVGTGTLQNDLQTGQLYAIEVSA